MGNGGIVAQKETAIMDLRESVAIATGAYTRTLIALGNTTSAINHPPPPRR